MFDSLKKNYNYIISEIGIVGYLEEDIIKRGLDNEANLPLNLLYSFPSKETSEIGNLIFQMMFPDDNHNIQSPKFFSLTLTNEQASRSFLYCLKFPEKYIFDSKDEENEEKEEQNKDDNKKENEPIKSIEVPLVIYIKSSKEDIEPFKQLLYSINQIIVNDNLEKQGYESTLINNYKKIQLINLLQFLFALPHTSPHSLIKLQLNKELDNILNLNTGNKNETIDFYFSSNCEIPCNKNDTDINVLFLILDQSIIIKVLFSILTEKQIIFSASQSYLLHLIISTFLKLIFPFKWHHSCITVVPKENLDVLEIPSSYIFGVLSSTLSTKDLVEEYPGKIIVDCDTNEIFGYSNLEPYEPPEVYKEKQSDADKKKKDKEKKKDKDKDKDKDIEFSNLDTENFAQGKNIIIINKNLIMKYQHEIHGKKQKLSFDSDNNIIIDTQQSKLFIDKNDIFIDSNEWKWLRKNIQLVRNPEIFNLDNIDIVDSRNTNRYLLNDEDNPILPNRAFSYNIQNIILTFILKKLSFTESDFMTVFKKTNLYLDYQDSSKKYENNKGKKIIQNIEETKNEPRSIDNSLNIEYILNSFNSQTIIDKIDEKINKNEKEEKLISELKRLLKPFKDYSRIKEEIINGNNDNESIYYLTARKPSISEFRVTGGSAIKTKIGKNVLGHVKNNTSLLQETCGHNSKYVLLGINKDTKDAFQFYTKKGFIYFLTQFAKFVKEENLNIKNIVYSNSINSQILNLINQCFIEKEIKENENGNEDNNDLGDFDKQSLRKALGVSIVPEKKEEEVENENENIDGESEGSVKIKKEEEYDFTENLIKGIKKTNIEIPKIKGIYENDDNIINFPLFDFEKERKKNNNENEDNNKNKTDKEINQLMQYYLFLAYYLQQAKKEESSLNYFKENIKIKNFKNNDKDKDDKNNIDKNEKLNINELILRLYKLAYNYSDKNHRDYPYYSYFNFINEMDSEELKSLNNVYDILEEDGELIEIYSKVIMEKQQIELKQLEKKEMKSYRSTTSITRINKNNKPASNDNDNDNDNDINIMRKSNVDMIKNKNKIGSKNIFSLLHKRQSIQPPKSGLDLVNENINPDDFDINSCYLINSTSEFNSTNNNNISPSIINQIGELLMKEFPKEKKIDEINIFDFIEEMNNKIKDNKDLINLVGQLKHLKIELINTKIKCLAFWLNCFNYLILFTIFYKKWNITGEKRWKKFFKNSKFDIGGKYFSFNDMEYIIFKKPSFFPSTYKVTDEIKKLNIEKINGDKKFDDYSKYTPFLLYLPIKKFLSPSLYDETNFENQVNLRIKNYINQFIYMDEKKHLCCSELLLKYESNIFGRGIKKYELFFNPEIYNNIKEKKYKKLDSQKITWNLNFDYLTEKNTK